MNGAHLFAKRWRFVLHASRYERGFQYHLRKCENLTFHKKITQALEDERSAQHRYRKVRDQAAHAYFYDQE